MPPRRRDAVAPHCPPEAAFVAHGFACVISLSDRGSAPDLPDGRALEKPVQWADQKYFAFPFGRNIFMDSAVPPKQRGVSRSSRTLGRDAVDAAASCARGDRRAGDEPVSGQQHADERRCSVRRSRVVLTPRRWRQVCGCCVGPTGRGHNVSQQATVAKEPGHRGEREGTR